MHTKGERGWVGWGEERKRKKVGHLKDTGAQTGEKKENCCPLSFQHLLTL